MIHPNACSTLVDVGFSQYTTRSYAQAFIKRTYSIAPDGDLQLLDEAIPLQTDWREEPEGLLMGSDLQWKKALVDIVIEGDVVAPGEVTTDVLDASCQIGSVKRRMRVFGNREVWWSEGRYRVSTTEPFARMPVSFDYAYGGYDIRLLEVTDFSEERAVEVMADLLFSRARYPRNPWGRGYLCQPGAGKPGNGVPMPNLEDPDDLLTEERLLAAPDEWWKQPLPIYMGWMDWRMFPRPRYAGYQGLASIVDKSEELSEVTRGWLSRESLLVDEHGAPLHYETALQDAALGLRLEAVPEDTPISLEHFHPEHPRLRFSAPAAPEVVFRIDGASEPVPARLLQVVIRPNELSVSFTWHARIHELEQLYVPELHPIIPVEAQIDGQPPVVYRPPPVVELRQEDFDR